MSMLLNIAISISWSLFFLLMGIWIGRIYQSHIGQKKLEEQVVRRLVKRLDDRDQKELDKDQDDERRIDSVSS